MEEKSRLDVEILKLAKNEKPIHLKFEFPVKESLEVHEVNVPQHISQLNPVQFEALTAFIFAKSDPGELIVLNFLRELLQLELKFFTLFSDEDIKDLRFLLTNFIQNEPVCNKCLFPELELKSKSLFGPEIMLANLVLDEYIYIEQLYMSYLKDRDNESSLNKLVAVLYRDKETDFETYLKQEPAALNEIAEVFPSKKTACFYSYMAMRNFLIQYYDKVFAPNPSIKKGKSFGWRRTIKNLAGPKFGTTKEVRTAPMLDVMMYLQDMVPD